MTKAFGIGLRVLAQIVVLFVAIKAMDVCTALYNHPRFAGSDIAGIIGCCFVILAVFIFSIYLVHPPRQ